MRVSAVRNACFEESTACAVLKLREFAQQALTVCDTMRGLKDSMPYARSFSSLEQMDAKVNY